ncbi:MAG: clan AA aspartic protease [Rubrobacteraceae bacterium]|nr:clan AA aspartic protease [Rubrobacteraceae bacterium]
MITGRVTSDGREAVVALYVLGREERSQRIEVVIDTGFTGYLTLPVDATASLGLPERGSETFMLADGSEAVLPVYRGGVVWHGRDLRIPVSQADGGALVGMSLLRGSRLRVDAVPGGDVQIEEL